MVIINDILRNISIAKGLEPPLSEAMCICKTDTPSLHELELSSRKHRLKEVQRLQLELFNAFMKEVTENEIEILDLFNLPDIEIVRRASFGAEDEGYPVFSYTEAQNKKLGEITNTWLEEILGTELAKKEVEPMEAPYPYYMLSVYSYGLRYHHNNAVAALPGSVDPEILEALRLTPSFNEQYIKAVVRDGGKRIKTKLGVENLRAVRKELKKMAATGEDVLKVGSYIHKKVGEGTAWYWNRIARSEATLAFNAAFNATAQRYNIPYAEWSAASNACVICQYFDGRTWKIGEAPEPVTSTHPHCLCVLRTIWVAQDRTIEGNWDRSTPYQRSYSKEELDFFRQAA